jgi:hypothetical protein
LHFDCQAMNVYREQHEVGIRNGLEIMDATRTGRSMPEELNDEDEKMTILVVVIEVIYVLLGSFPRYF